MKSVKAFVLLMLALYAGLLLFDWLKLSVFPQKHHELMIWLKTVFLVAGGTFIMYLTLEKKMFGAFIVIYLLLWLIYKMLQWIVAKTGGQVNENAVSMNNLLLFYLNITQLITPFPFFFFWVLNRVYKKITEES